MITLDAEKLLAYMDSKGIAGSTKITRGWSHMGAIVVDAVLQRRQKYKSTVLPRVQALIAAWPDAETTSGFRQHLDQGGLSGVIRWSGQERLTQIDEVVKVFESDRFQIDTVNDLRAQLSDAAQRQLLRSALREVDHVGPKTVDYFDILAGIDSGTAIDVRIRRHMRSAGISNLQYGHVQAVIRAAADIRQWRHGDVDAALWNA
jgi:hypothetical protein